MPRGIPVGPSCSPVIDVIAAHLAAVYLFGLRAPGLRGALGGASVPVSG